jgi:GNAT superfamily N-acetyltransferase
MVAMKSIKKPVVPTSLKFRPLSEGNWADLEQLFGPRGASGGCWCMWWRLRRSEYEKSKGEGNRQAFRKIVESRAPTGVLAYMSSQPVGWCAVAPRTDYPVLERSRILKPVDSQPVWSVTCFYVPREHRRSGLTSKLLAAAVEYARKQGAKIVEGYPQDPKSGSVVDAFAWTGFASAFKKAGFKEVARRSATRPVMRISC